MNEQQPAHPSYSNYATGAKPHKPRKSHKKSFILVAAVLVVAVLATLVVLQQIKINADTADAVADQKIQDQVAKIMVIPGEDALVSDIENADQVKSQPFFANVENGDKVLVFVGAAKIVVYRPSTHQIVNAGPIVDDSKTTTDSTK